MTDSYQAIYDAVRSRITGGNIGEVVAEQARQAFDISWTKASLQSDIAQAIYDISEAHRRPSVLMRPALAPDGNQWCACYGLNLQEGVAGFGDTPEAAMTDFDRAWRNEKCGATP